MKHLSLLLVLCLVSASACVAQQSDADQPASSADIERYYEVMHVRDLMRTTADAVSKQMRQIMHEQIEKNTNLPPDAEQQMDKMYDKAMQSLPVDDLLQAMEPVYEKHLTKGDVDALIAFYSSPTGQKVLTQMPAITQEAMQASSGVIRQYMDQTMQQVQDQIAQMQKNYHPDPKKAVSTN